MGKITLITGGARSGKSDFAEGLIEGKASVCYLATSTAANIAVQDAEMIQRIQLHQARRPAQWDTHEGYKDLAEFIQRNNSYQFFLLDCATMFTFNAVYGLLRQEYNMDYQQADAAIIHFAEAEKKALEDKIMEQWQAVIASIRNNEAYTLIVTNEVGLGIVPENALARWFRDVYGRVNQRLGKEADAAYFVMSGIPMKIK